MRQARWWAAGAAAALAALATAACGSAERGSAQFSPDEPLQVRAVAEAEIFAPGVISDEREQWRITFTPDGRTAYYTASDGFFPFTRQATIYVSHYRRGQWSLPEVAPFSGVYSDIDPFISPDGQRLYFSSIRPVDGVLHGDIDIWMVERTPRVGASRFASDRRSIPTPTSCTRRNPRMARSTSRAARRSRSPGAPGTSTARAAKATASLRGRS